MKHVLGKLKEQKGATAVEYALMVLFIATVIVVSVAALGSAVNTEFTAFMAAW